MEPTSDDDGTDNIDKQAGPPKKETPPAVIISYGDSINDMRSNMHRITLPEGVNPEEFSITLERTVKAITSATEYAAKEKRCSVPRLDADDIYFGLKKYVMFQDEALKQVSVAVSNHLKQIPEVDTCARAEEILDYMEGIDFSRLGGAPKVEVARKGLFIIGNSGTGKSYTLERLAKELGVPFVSVDATRFTLEGYIGGKITDIYEMAVEKATAMGDTNLYKYAIFHFDEVDKLVSGKTNGKDVNGGPVLESLLGHMQSGTVRVKQRVGMNEQIVNYDTSNMLFVFSGACEGIEDIIRERLNKGKSKMGFAARGPAEEDGIDEKNIMQQVTREDLTNWGAGFPRQFLGRIGAVIPLKDFTAGQLAAILTEPKNSFFDQYRHVWAKQGMYLKIDEGAVEAVAKKAAEEKLGARGLTHVLDPILNSYQFDLGMMGAKGLTLTREVIDDPEASRKYVIMEGLAEMGMPKNKNLSKCADEVIASLDGDCKLAQQVKEKALSQYTPQGSTMSASGEA